LNLEHAFAAKYHNKVMLSTFTMEFYNLEPEQEVVESGEKDYSKIVWV